MKQLRRVCKSSCASNVKEYSIGFSPNALVHFNIVHRERKPVGFAELGFCNIQFFRLHGKNVTELIQTYFYGAETGKSAKEFICVNSLKSPATLQKRPDKNLSIRILKNFASGAFCKEVIMFYKSLEHQDRPGLLGDERFYQIIYWNNFKISFLGRVCWFYTGNILYWGDKGAICLCPSLF